MNWQPPKNIEAPHHSWPIMQLPGETVAFHPKKFREMMHEQKNAVHAKIS